LQALSIRYPEPDSMAVDVFTDMSQESCHLEPPRTRETQATDDELLKRFGVSNDFAFLRRHFIAALFRANGNQVVRYRAPNGSVKTLIVSGSDIFPDLDDRGAQEDGTSPVKRRLDVK
ncbi:MAG: hypothetical protein ACREAC_04805, partial [Blastocatellia bacterium]